MLNHCRSHLLLNPYDNLLLGPKPKILALAYIDVVSVTPAMAYIDNTLPTPGAFLSDALMIAGFLKRIDTCRLVNKKMILIISLMQGWAY